MTDDEFLELVDEGGGRITLTDDQPEMPMAMRLVAEGQLFAVSWEPGQPIDEAAFVTFADRPDPDDPESYHPGLQVYGKPALDDRHADDVALIARIVHLGCPKFVVTSGTPQAAAAARLAFDGIADVIPNPANNQYRAVVLTRQRNRHE